MNNHDKYAALLDAFIDGELSAQEAGEVREHLTLCADCGAYVSDALTMRDAFPDIEETIVPDGFTESVLAALPPRQIPWRTQWKKVALPLAACLAIVLLVRGLLPGNRIGESTGGAMVDKTEDTLSEEVTSDMDAGGGTPMLSMAYNPDDADTMPPAGAGYSSDDADTADYRYDDADTMPPQASEANSATESAAPKKSAPEQRSAAESMPETEEALDGVPLAAGSVETNTVTESAFDENTAPDTVNSAAPVPEADSNMLGVSAPVPEPNGNASGVSAPVPEPERDALGDSVAENAEAELFSAPSVWMVPVEAASLLELYARAGETKSGVWYALTADEFDALSLKLADSDMEPVPGGDTPPPTLPDAEYYIFVPLR